MTTYSAAGAAAALLLAMLALAPPPPALIATAVPSDARVVSAAIHVHSTVSDGGRSVDDIAAAAARAGLNVIVVTDHGDGTRETAPPMYRSGVLCLNGVEISTSGGHYVALGLPRAPYPLGGDSRDVVEDVRRLGGFGIAAHPDSTRRELAWADRSADIDAFEAINLDSGWRRASPATAALVIGSYWLRAPQSLAVLADIFQDAAAMWDEWSATRRIVALAASDAHGATVGPSYEATFRTLSTHIELTRPLTGDADVDAASVMSALRAGHAYLAVDALAQPAVLRFAARRAGTSVGEGDELDDTGRPVTFEVLSSMPPGARIVLLKDGRRVASSLSSTLTYGATDGENAAYRAEVRLPGGPDGILWQASNAIYVGRRFRPSASPRSPASIRRSLLDAGAWHVEHNATSEGALVGAAPVAAFAYALGDGEPRAQFAAIVRTATQLTGWRAITIDAHASRAMRVTVALRSTAGDRRWQRSIYLDQESRIVRLPLDSFTPVTTDDPPSAPLADIGALMVGVDCNRTLPGSRGTITVADIALER